MEEQTSTPAERGNSKLWIGIGVVVVILIALALLFMGRGGTPGSAAVSGAEPQSLEGLLQRGGSQKCTFSNTAGDVTSSGTVYIGGGMLRGDFTTTGASAEQNNSGHFIVKDNTTYVWIEGLTQGFKSSFSGSVGNPNSQIDPSAPGNYNCTGWSVDSSVFGLPTGVSFTDVGAPPVQGSAPGSAGAQMTGSAAQCGQCDQIPDANGKAQCRAALHC